MNLFHATVRLDEANFLKPDYNVNSKEIETVLAKIQKDFFSYVDGLREKGKEWSQFETQHLAEISKALPNTHSIKEYYSSEINKIKDEALEDKSIKEIVDVLTSTFGTVFNTIIEIINDISITANAIADSLRTTLTGIIDIVEKDLIPPIRELADRLATVTTEITRSVLEIISAYLATISQLIEKYQPQFKEISAIFGEIGKDIGRFIQNAYLQSAEIVINLFNKIYNEIKALPLYDELKAQYEEVIILRKTF